MAITTFDNLIEKVRALIGDFGKTSYEVFTYTTSNIFTIAEDNITITNVLINGESIDDNSGQDYDFDSDTNKITITADLSTDDIIEVDFSFYKYSTSELTEYIRAALVWLSIYSYCDDDFELEDESFFPTPSNAELDLIAIIASILIKPNYSQYDLTNVKVRYPKTMTKEQKIEKIINRFKVGLGTSYLLIWED